MPELRLHVTTIGAPSGEPVLILHGTAGSAASMLVPAFAGELFGPGQPLDASKYYIILPDAHRHRQVGQAVRRARARSSRATTTTTWSRRSTASSAKASACATCAWSSATRWAACTPGSGACGIRSSWTRWCRWRASRPRWRGATGCCAACSVETIRSDPGWKGGNYTTQPRSLALASGLLRHRHQRRLARPTTQAAPTREQADKLVDARLAAPFAADANDIVYQWASSRRLQRFARARAHRGARAGDQLGRRRAQPARAEASWSARCRG